MTSQGKTPTDKEYKRRQRACKCLPAERRGYVEAAMAFAGDFSDGAFFAFMEEKGIDVSDLECFSLEHDCTKAISGKVE